MMNIKDQYKIGVIIGLLLMFVLLVVRPWDFKKQVKRACYGKVVNKKFLDHNKYWLIIHNGQKMDTLHMSLWDRDFSKITIGDSVAKSAESDDLYLYKIGCNEPSCASLLALSVPVF